MNIGEKIFYPMHGAGEIVGKEGKIFDGEEVNYCTVSINIKDLQLQFPENNAELLNIRKLSAIEEIELYLKKAADIDFVNDGNWNKKYQHCLDMLKTGNIEDMCSVIVNFFIQDMDKGLSSGERQLYHTGFNVLVSEIMYILDYDKEKASNYLDEQLRRLCE